MAISSSLWIALLRESCAAEMPDATARERFLHAENGGDR
jgi:hypothetical protein